MAVSTPHPDETVPAQSSEQKQGHSLLSHRRQNGPSASAVSRLSSSSSSSSISPLSRARVIFASAARLVQKAPRRVFSAFVPGKSDSHHVWSRSSASRDPPPPPPTAMTIDNGDLMGIAHATAPSSMPDIKKGINFPDGASHPCCGDDSTDTQSGRVSLAGSAHSFAPLRPLVPLGEAGRPERTPEEDAIHEAFTQAALEMARLALRTNETPVGCVLVHNGKVIAKGMNATNVTRNGTRHAEFMAVCSLLSQPNPGSSDVSFTDAAKTARAFHEANQARKAAEAAATAAAMLAGDNSFDGHSITSTSMSISSIAPSISSSVQAATRVKVEHEGVAEEDVAKSYLYPYGQKWWPESKFDPVIFHECTLYVTVEPCVMCASFLRQLGIQKVFFGAVNDKFGGTGGVFNIHKNCKKLDETQVAQGTDGGPVGRGFDVEGGWGRDEAVALLRRFYVQENGRAPVPRKKEGRAARLAALEQVNGITVGDVDAGMLSSLESSSSSQACSA